MFVALASFCSSALFLVHEEKAFVSWMRETSQYFNGDEYQARLGVWLSNARFVQEHNRASSYQLAMNHLSALTPSEYRALLGYKGGVGEYRAKAVDRKGELEIPESLDWRDEGVVAVVKDQGSCGSCWAFAAIASAEGAYALAKKELLSLSESNLIDCVTNCHGCNGGLSTTAWFYVITYQNGKFMLESDYPYKPIQKSCAFNSAKGVGSVSSFVNVKSRDEDDLAKTCAEHGPVAVAIDSSRSTFHQYKSGIYDDTACSDSDLNHAVVCVGYGAENSKKYWIVKNSWGTSWGEKGYVRIIWNGNRCGIATAAACAIA